MAQTATSVSSKRLKLPPYGRELLTARESGNHPNEIVVVYGAACWQSRPDGAVSVCVDESYQHGVYDWSLLAGVPARVIWLSGENVFDLVAEVASVTAPVIVETQRNQTIAPNFLWEYRGKWRSILWNQELDDSYYETEHAYHLALLADIQGDA